MSSIAADPLLKVVKIFIFTVIAVAFCGVVIRYVYPQAREYRKANIQYENVMRKNSDIERQIAAIRKNRTEFQSNNLDFIKLTGYREGMFGPKDVKFYFAE